MSEKLIWNTVSRQQFTHTMENRHEWVLGYRLDSLPNFTDHRFDYLCKEIDQRAGEVGRKQLTMLRAFHALDEDWTISLRILKKDNRLHAFVLFRLSSHVPISDAQKYDAQKRIRNALPEELYSFEPMSSEELDEALDVSWANEVAEIYKEEQEYYGDVYPTPTHDRREFYCPKTWMPADNSMQDLCAALMHHSGRAVAEVTLSPTQYLQEERDWVNVSIRELSDCSRGETLKGKDGKIIWRGRELPILKVPLDIFEKLNKQYETSYQFLSSIRVFADDSAHPLADAYKTNSTRSAGSIQVFRKGFRSYEYVEKCYQTIDVSGMLHTRYWNSKTGNIPFRAQRLCRMVSVEEASNFFRLPIPVQSSFPGFEYDTGLGGHIGAKNTGLSIRIGTYLDEHGMDKPEAGFAVQQLAKHGLIVGVPGSGKTTAMFNILYQLWDAPEDQRIPFIILEPAKTEYRALKTLPLFKDDMLVFTLGDESVSPFRFNPMAVLPGVKIESHISKLQACFVGAFDLFDPLPIFLEQAIRRTYAEKGWYEDSKGGDPGLETPTLADLSRNAEYIVSHSGFDAKMKSDFNASLLERLNSLQRGSKGRMLNTPETIPMETLMKRPIVMELDSLNGDEKSLMMMFLLSYVYEYCKVQRKSGSPLKHMLLVEEAHNLIGAQGAGSDSRANPKGQTIELFVNMLAEMRALGQGILIADQLPTAIAPQAVKQTNVKVLMRVTAKDDREEIGNTMDLNEEQMHQVVNFKTGHAYLYHEGENRVRSIRMVNFKGEHNVEEPPEDDELKQLMQDYEISNPGLFMPYPQCSKHCTTCSRRVRNQAESFVDRLNDPAVDLYELAFHNKDKKQLDSFRTQIGVCSIVGLLASKEGKRILERYGEIGDKFGPCVYVHLQNKASALMDACSKKVRSCSCKEKRAEMEQKFGDLSSNIHEK